MDQIQKNNFAARRKTDRRWRSEKKESKGRPKDCDVISGRDQGCLVDGTFVLDSRRVLNEQGKEPSSKLTSEKDRPIAQLEDHRVFVTLWIPSSSLSLCKIFYHFARLLRT